MSTPVSIGPTVAGHASAQQFLLDRIDYERLPGVAYQERQFKLDRMRQLLDRLGSPQQGLPIVHVAGTKGKGSTAAMMGAVLAASQYRTGVFTSPHLDRLEERMAVDGRPCSPEELVALVETVAPVVELMDREAEGKEPADRGPTYFEIATAMALLHFVRRKVDAAVLEVGLGGRLDSTNVCHPQVSLITSISFDHTRQLGDTLESIAREKAGIIKEGVPVISGVRTDPARRVIRRICEERRAPLRELGTDFEFRYHPPRGLESADAEGSIDFWFTQPGTMRLQGLPLRLVGRHQAANAAVALAALAELEKVGWRVDDRAVRKGLAELVWPARVELLSRLPAVVVDAAHNLASVDALLDVLNESYTARKRYLVLATTREKDVPGMIRRLASQFDQIFFTRYVNNPRSVPPEELEAIASQVTGKRYPVCAGPTDAWLEVRRLAEPQDLICVTGSFFIAAEMRREILRRPWGRDPV
jgi:dihydrofolate synthase/folylpolyglutamate synthase